MAIVSISEAARLTGKARSTIQTQIKAGKLSKTTDPTTGAIGIDTSELIRVFGSLNTTGNTLQNVDQIIQHRTVDATPDHTAKISHLEAENKRLSDLLEAKQETINSLNKAMLILEHKAYTETPTPSEKSQETPKKGFWSWFKK